MDFIFVVLFISCYFKESILPGCFSFKLIANYLFVPVHLAFSAIATPEFLMAWEDKTGLLDAQH